MQILFMLSLLPLDPLWGGAMTHSLPVLFMSSFDASLSCKGHTFMAAQTIPPQIPFQAVFPLELWFSPSSAASHTLYGLIMFKLTKTLSLCVNYNSVACFRFVQQLGSQQQVISMATRGIGGAQKQVVRIEGSRATVQGNTKVKIQGMAVLMSAVIFMKKHYIV